MRYRFGSCELVSDRHELWVDGSLKTVEPQVFDLLSLFVANPQRLLTHDALIEAVWGGRIVSDSAVSARISAARAAIGDDGARQAMIKTVPRRGYRFIGHVETEVDASGQDSDAIAVGADSSGEAPERPERDRQSIRFCTSRDGTTIAYGVSGIGPPLLRAGHWLTHLEHDWHSPVWRPFLDELDRRFQVTRYDQRGNGLSDWDVTNFTLDRFVEDLEAVVDAAGLDRFVLLGTSQGAPISIAYACRHPQRISRLVLLGGFARGRAVRASPEEREQGEALLAIMRHGWAKAGSPFLRAFISMYLPNGTREQIDSVIEMQRLTTSAENAVALRKAVDSFDVSDLLARVSVPTLVIHARDDGIQPLSEGRALAAGIPGAEFAMLDTASHVVLSHDPAWHQLFDAISRFTAQPQPAAPEPRPPERGR